MTAEPTADYRAFLAARDFLLGAREDYDMAGSPTGCAASASSEATA